jgi:DNA helicase-2/ATP-dependent DNA helicase PcrA
MAAFETLNPRQREAATYGQRAKGAFHSGPLVILAGAGTGKTNTLAHRVAHLILEGTSPERILLLTFTRRAALEMTRRAQRIVGEVMKEVRLPWSGTFHSIANRLIRRHCKAVALGENFSVLDRGDAADLMDLARCAHVAREPSSAGRAKAARRSEPLGGGGHFHAGSRRSYSRFTTA